MTERLNWLMNIYQIGWMRETKHKGLNTAQFHLPEVSKGKFREAESRRVVLRTGRRVCYKIFVAGWKSSRDKLNNTVHWMNRTDWTLQSIRGKAGLNFIYAFRFLLSQILLDLGVACRYHQGSCRRKEPLQYWGPWLRGTDPFWGSNRKEFE